MDIDTAQEMPCEAVYSLVLESGHTVMIGNFECVTLGHGLDGAVVGHPYLGTAKVVDDLKRFEGWQRGLVEFSNGCVLRDRDGLMCAWDASKVMEASHVIPCEITAATPPESQRWQKGDKLRLHGLHGEVIAPPNHLGMIMVKVTRGPLDKMQHPYETQYPYEVLWHTNLVERDEEAPEEARGGPLRHVDAPRSGRPGRKDDEVKVEILHKLWRMAIPMKGLPIKALVELNEAQDFNKTEARKAVQGNVDYFCERAIKVDFRRSPLSYSGYDAEHGRGAAALALRLTSRETTGPSAIHRF